MIGISAHLGERPMPAFDPSNLADHAALPMAELRARAGGRREKRMAT